MKTETEQPKPEELRPMVHGKIDGLDVRGLALIHRVLLQLEAEKLAGELREEFGSEQNLIERVDNAVAEFRKANPYR
jgi:hypothetical protein